MERVNKPEQKIISSVELLELLDLEERGDLAEQLNLPRPDRLNDKAFQDEILKVSATTLLGRILHLRQPLIRMLQEIYAFLSEQKARGRSTTRAIILPRAEKDLNLVFDGVMENVVAIALDRRRQKDSLEAIAQQINHITDLLLNHISVITSTFVQFDTDVSRTLGDVADPTFQFIAQHFREFRQVYHRHDLDCVEDLHSQMEEISTKLEQLTSAIQQTQSANATTVNELLSSYAHGMQVVEDKLYDMRSSQPDAWDVTSPNQSIYERDWDSLLEEISVLKETIFAACEFEEAATSIYDFFNLELWRDRWRIYELWMLTHIMEVFECVGFEADISARVTNQVWDLKFTKDSTPIATLIRQGVTLEVYYQLYEKNTKGGDMPDIAIKERGGGYIFVLDPKYGRSYRQGELTELAARYARAFSATLTVIHNFYPLSSYDYLAVSNEPACVVGSDIAPDTENLRRLDQELGLHPVNETGG